METEGVNGGKHCVQALVGDREKFRGDDRCLLCSCSDTHGDVLEAISIRWPLWLYIDW